eukprot:CAMPEP_0182939662 /NCGR_PEP_ID=MMETSP0105_2-20130417/45968_1 /TAXON_ID=81532 ORGANISM="Acanthoeca-like sp., Strain 10tr" /NCGR_SAMPLE_ID=MMETSP0105_2 /ASSEMBLY_ACC=CAM_ASM_000205 /LENGTH=720 /DNA_ID=CAMNT_0025079079 /DNA_START=14 /DNA_END=2176 /DNA_ORIENTATION=-
MAGVGGPLSALSPADVAMLARDTPAGRYKLDSWATRLSEMHRVAGILGTTLDDFVRSGREHREKTKALAEAFGTAAQTFSMGLLPDQAADALGGDDRASAETLEPRQSGEALEAGNMDALSVLSDTLYQVAEYQKMLLSQTQELTLSEVMAFKNKAATLVAQQKKLADMMSVRNQAIGKLCQSSPQMVGQDGADPEYIKRANRVYTAKRHCSHAAAAFVTDLGAFETEAKAVFLKRLTEQVFVHHGFFKQAAGVFDDASPQATAFFGVLNDGIASSKPMAVQLAEHRDAAAALADLEYSANVLTLPKQRRVAVATPPAAEQKGLMFTMKRLRQAAKDKMNEVAERKGGLLEAAPPADESVDPDAVTNRVLSNGKEGWVLRREKGALLTTWKPAYLKVDGDTLVETDASGVGPDKPLTNLALLNVRRSEKAINDRLDCLDLISPSFSMVMQTQGPRDCTEWERVLSSGIVSAIHGSGESIGLSNKDLDLLQQVDGNEQCADCGAPHPEWSSVNLGVMVCLRCSGGHRALGVGFSKVRSARLDSWSADAVELMMKLGNGTSNEYYEHRMPPNDPFRPTADSAQDDVNAFILAKYVERRWATPGEVPPGQPGRGHNGAAGGQPAPAAAAAINGHGALKASQGDCDLNKSASASSMASIDLSTAASPMTAVDEGVSATIDGLAEDAEVDGVDCGGDDEGLRKLDSLEVGGSVELLTEVKGLSDD